MHDQRIEEIKEDQKAMKRNDQHNEIKKRGDNKPSMEELNERK